MTIIRRNPDESIAAHPEPRARLELVRGEGQRAPAWPKAFAADICDELCSAVDEAVTLEAALRAMLRTLCRRMRLNAGRGTHRETLPVWHVDSHETIPSLLRVVRPRHADERPVVWQEPWTVTRHAGFTSIVFPIEWDLGTYLELFSTDHLAPPADALEDIACALVPAGALLRRKRGERAEQAANERSRERLETAAFTDALTGLPNRAAFDRHLSMAVERARAGALFAVLFVDLDRFKSVNDGCGHAAGDALLCEVARRLRSELRSGDLAARLGGDEFTVLLPLRDLAEAIPVAERVQASLLQPFEVSGTALVPSASIGVAFAGPHATTSQALLHEADAAMYRAKAKGPGNVVFASFTAGQRGAHGA